MFDQDLGEWDVGSVTNMDEMFNGVTLSRENYDSLLAGWSEIDMAAGESALQTTVTFNAGNSQYCNQEAKAVLLALGWRISDGDIDTDGNCALRFAAGTSIANQVYPVDTVITLVLPFAVGGVVPITYSLGPLPPGLSLRAPTADIAPLLIGTPSAIMSASPVTYTAIADNGDTATLTFMITVVRALPPATLTLGTDTDSGVDLNLKFPIITADGKIYYYLDADNSGEGDSPDLLRHIVLDNLLNNGADTEGTKEGMHDGSDDSRSVIVGAYTLILPTLAELRTLRTDQDDTYPFNWGNGFYRSATRPAVNPTHRHHIYDLEDASERVVSDFGPGGYVAFQVLSFVPISFKQSEYVISEGTTRTITLVAEQLPVVETRIRIALLSEISGTTILDEKYRLSTTFITFNPNQSEASFEVSILDDTVFQETREFSLSIVPLNNSALGAMPDATIRVENDDAKIRLTTGNNAGNSLSVTEGSDLSATLRLHIDPPVNRKLSVKLRYTGDVGALTGALSSVDTPDISTVITVSANTAVHDFDVMVKDDQIAAEPTRTATILLEPGPGYLVLDTDNSTVKISVEDDDVASVSFSQSEGTVTEGELIELIITQDLITDIATSVNITFTPTGNFFETTPITTQVDFPAGGVVMSTSRIVIPTVNDTDVEADGSLRANIVIMPGSPLQPGMSAERTVTILNDDVPAISFQQGAYTIFEGNIGTITLVADQTPVVEARIRLTTDLITISNEDYQLSTTTIVFEPSQSEASFEVSTSAREGFQVTRELLLSFELDTDTATRGAVFETIISVKDNSAPIASLEIVGGNPRLEEEDRTRTTLRVTLDRSFEQATTIQIVTTGTATLGQSSGGDGDYTININRVMLSAGSTYAETTLEVNDDVQVEADETIILTLEADTEQIIDDEPTARLALTIKDNDVPAISFEQADYDISEGTTATVTLVADQLPVVEARIRLTTLSGTVSDDKYQLSTTMVVFEPGQRTASFEVKILNDNMLQATRELRLSFDPLTNSTRGEVFVTVISVEDNAAPIASLEIVGGIRLEEEDRTRTTLRITLDRTFNQNTTIRIVTAGTATTEDYTININRFMFLAGSTYAETTLEVNDDMQVEADETIILTLVADTDLIIDDRSGAQLTLTIEDNDVPAISFDRDVYNIAEGTTGTVTLVADQRPVVEARINLTTLSGTISDNEYRLSTTIVVFEPGQSTASFEVKILNDNMLQATRELRLSFNPLTNSTRGEVFVTVIRVEDNAVPAIRFERPGYDISEGTTGTVILVADQRPMVETRIMLTTGLDTTLEAGDYKLSTTIITFAPDQSTVSFEVSIIDDNDVQATRKLRLSFVPLDKNSKSGTVSETVITVEDDELGVSLRAPGQTECRSPSPPESTPNCRIVVTEIDGFGTLQLEANRLTTMPLTVNLRYTADVGALTGELTSDNTQEMSTMITVATNTTTRHTFKVRVIDDEIAAEGTRTANILLQQPGVGYTVSDTDNTVEIAVVDDDIATVSISPLRGRVIEGDTIVFTITRDLAIDQASSITLTLTHNGDFFSPAMDTLDFDEHEGINLNLAHRHQRNGKVYYYLDRDDDSIPPHNDQVSHTLLDNLLNNGDHTENTQLTGHDGSDDERSVIIDDYALVLPTVTEILAFFANNGVPDGWNNRGPYWSAELRENQRHSLITIRSGINTASARDNAEFHVFFQVLTAQRTIIVNLPAEPMGTVTVEVKTIDTDDSITDGSLIAELIAVTSPIELGSTVSEVVILHNNSVVTITGPTGLSSVTVDENSSATLAINVGPSVPNHRSLDVNLSYIDLISGTMEMRTIEVPAGSTSYEFPFPVGDDDIAAQSTRFFNVLLEPGDYVVGTPSSVAVSVLNDDDAVVSILPPVGGPITEGNEAVFEVQVSNEIATSLIVTIDLATVGDFGISQGSTNVVINAGTTTALLTVITDDDETGEAYGSLTATVVPPLRPRMQVSGVQPTISTTNSSAMATILDNDLDLVVSITTLDNTISESDEVISLRLMLSAAINRSLRVDLSYAGDTEILGMDSPFVVEVPAGMTTHPFTVPIINDRIAAQSTRVFNVTVESGLGYGVRDPSSVEISVLNGDPAVVSVFAVSDIVDEGTTALFTVQVSNEIATSLAVTINLTTIGNFGISPGSINLVINAGTTTALLTAGRTINDETEEAYGSLIATIDSPLALPESVSGVKPTISTTNSSATVTILDDDLDLSVRITTLDDNASTTVSESDEVISLRLILSATINRPLRVNLSRDTEISGIDLPSFVDVPADTTTHNFTVFVIDDTIVAQPERNIDISVATGVGYTALTVPVTVNVIDDDTATVTISPSASGMITAGENAEFDVVLGLMTAVDVEIGIDVGFGGVFITDRGRTTVTVSEGQTSVLLTVQTMENTGIAENSSLVATLRAIPHRALEIGTPSSASVVINALSPLSITATPASLSLVEGGASTEINVSLNRIPADSDSVTVMINLPEGSGLRVSSPLLMFRTTVAQIVTVRATNIDGNYMAPRSEMLPLIATNYTTAMVTVEITDNIPQPEIELVVAPTTVPNLVRFTSTEIEVSVAVDAMLNIETEGAVTLADGTNSVNFNLIGVGERSTRIGIFGNSVGNGEVTVTADGIGAGAGAEPRIQTVSVMVSTPTLVITGVRPSTINLLTQETTVVIVSVRAESGDVMLGATIDDKNIAEVRLGMTNVQADTTTATVTVTGLNVAGETALTLTAEHPDYEPASIEVPVSVYLPGVGLSATPTSLQFEQGATESFTVAVSASTQAMITIRSGNDGIARVSSQAFTLLGGESNPSAEVVVSGDGIGETILRIEAVADGYATETATVMVDVLNRFRIGAMPATFNLAEGSSRTISVSLTLIEANTTVTVNIAATTGLGVMPSSLTFSSSSPEPQDVRVTVDDDDKYEGDRSAILTLTADGYTTATVTVNITEDDLQPIELMVVGTTERNLVRFTRTDITVSVNVATGLTVKAEGAVSLVSGVAGYDLTEDALSQQIQIEAVSVGEGTITFTASGARQSTATEMVTVTVSTPALVISDVSALAINLVARTTTGLTVRVSAEAGVPEGVTLTATVSDEAGRVVSVNPTKRVIETVSVDTPAMFTVEGLDAGRTTLTLTAIHSDYELASTEVIVMVYLPGVELNVRPPSLRFEQGATESLMIEVRASTEATITISSAPSNIVSVLSQPFTLMGGASNNSTMIEVNGVGTGRTTLTITAIADGYANETATVSVEVLDPLGIEAMPVSVNLVEMEGEDSTQISVRVNRIPEGSSSVTVTINLPEGSELTVIPSSLEFTGTEMRTVTVAATNNNDYTGDREERLTFMASGYAPAMVTVNITEDDLQTIELMVVGTTALNLVRFSTTDITVSVDVATDLTVKAEGAVSLEEGAPSAYGLTEGALSQQIQIEAVSVGEGTITFTASGARQSTATEIVRVMVSTPALVISDVSALAINLVARTTTGLTVRVSAEAGVPEGVTLTATVSGEAGRVVSVNPMKRVIETVSVDTPAMFTVEGLDAGRTTLTLTAIHSDYELASTEVIVMVYLPGVELSVSPPSLQFEQGATASLTIEVRASTEATITISSAPSNIVSVLSQPFTLMGGASNNSTMIEVSGVGIGGTTLTITASADGYANETATVSVEVLDPLGIEAMPVSVNLVEMEGGDSTQISVRVNQIPEGSSSVTVTINLPEGSELTVIPSSLEFTGTETRTVTVAATNNNDYTGDREERLTFMASGYAAAMVTVNITEDDLQTIGLMVVGTTERNLVRFSTTDITVSVDVATDLTVKAEGAVSLEEGAPSAYRLTEGALSQQIQIEAVSVGEGTITFTASGARQSTATEIVRVMVSTPALVISDVSALAINLVARTTTGLTVRVSAEAGVPEGVTLTATVSGEAGRVVSVNPMKRVIETVSVDTPAMFTVEGLDAGRTTLMLTAIHSDYESASIDVSVSVYLPGVELSVSPPSLQFEQGATESLTVAVRASTEATITISSAPSNIVSVLSQPFTLMGGASNNSTMIEVSGVNIGGTTLTITASADGYATEEVAVSVVVQDLLRIEAMPATFNLAEGSSRTISVSLTLIEANTTVTVNIAATTGLSVMPSSLTFSSSSLEPQDVRVTVDDDNKYEGDRSTTLTLTAEGYTTATVTVNITEDDLQPIELMVVGTTERNLVRFSTTDITVSVDVATDLTVKAEGAVSLEEGAPSAYRLTEGALSQQIQIQAVSVGEGTITFTASGARQSTAMEMVTVMVSTPALVISDVSALAINLVARTTTGLTVRVSAEAGVPEGVTLTATVSGEAGRVVSVNPMKRVIETVSVDTPAMFTVESLDAGDTTITLTAIHSDYESASTEVIVMVYLPGVGLIVPTSLEIVREASEILTIEVSESTEVTLRIESSDTNIATVSSPKFTFMGGGDSRAEVRVNGVGTGRTTLTITAIADGYANETATVSVEVLDPLGIEAMPVSVNLVEMEGEDSTQISVRVNRIPEGSSSVTVTINLPEGSELTVIPSSLEFTGTETRTVTVAATNNNDYTGDREERLTFMASGYAAAMVTVNITEDDLQTIGLMVVGTTARNLVRFSTTDITVSVDVATDLTVKAEGAVSLEEGAPSAYRLTEGALSQQIQIQAVSVGEGTITFTASGARQSTATEIVRVMVSTPALVISDVSALAINLVARTTTGLTVRVSAEAGVPEGVTLTATVSGEAGRVVSVNPMKRVIETVSVDTPAMFTVEGLDAGRYDTHADGSSSRLRVGEYGGYL